MKKIFFTMFMLVLSVVTLAGSFVMLPYSGSAELKKHFSDPNLMVHFYTGSEVFATAKVFDARSMVLIDDDAFSTNNIYTLVYCPKDRQDAYLADNNLDALYGKDNYLIMKGAVKPFKNDGAVAIFNKEARLPRLTRDFPHVVWENPVIREMLDQVDKDSLEATVQHLQDYTVRVWNSDSAFAASDWIASRMEALGLEVEQQPFGANYWGMEPVPAAPNVIGIQRGTLYPDIYVVCGSHFDSFNHYDDGPSPGADDNATGVASVLESARIMTQYDFEYSIVYCAFGSEEIGLYGSAAYASRCSEQGMDIIGYFNNDMNGYLYGDQIHIDCIYPHTADPIGAYYMNVGSVYYPELPVRHVQFMYGDSDHTSFNNNGYFGIYPFEDYQNYSPYIHTTSDVIGISVNSFEMSQQYCQMNIACLAEVARPVGAACNPVVDFHIDYPDEKEMTWLYLSWNNPEAGSSGDLDHFDIYRDNEVIASVEVNQDPTYQYVFEDSIEVDDIAEYFVVAVYTDGCEAASQTEIGYGVEAINEVDSRIMIYPNPSDGIFNLDLGDSQCVVEVYEITGRMVYENCIRGTAVLDLGKYPKGMYFLKITGERQGMTTKIVIR